MHRSSIFFIPEAGEIRSIPQECYVKLSRGELALPEYANRAVRVADWYVELKDGRPSQVDNETYSLLVFDESGNIDWPNYHHGIVANHAFYQALKNSAYDDVDEDPAVQALRRKLGDEFTWLPNAREREELRGMIF